MREGWKEVSFGDVVQFPPKIKMKKGQSYPFIPMENLDSGIKYVKPLTEKKLSGSGSKFEEGDTLFARITPCLQNGKIAQAKELNQKPGFGSTEYFIFRGKKGITDTDFIYYLSRTHWFQQNAINSMVGSSGRQRADAGFLKSVKINLPPLPTQRKIASILSAYDDLIENNLRRIKLLEEKAQLTYEEWFVRLKFPGHEATPVDEETGLPEGWERVQLKEIADFKYGKMPNKAKVLDSGYPIYSGYRVTGGYSEYMFERPMLIVVARGVGGTGDVKLSPPKCWLTNLSIAVKVNERILQNYLYYLLKDSNLRSLDSGAAQSQITINSLENLQITQASIHFQRKFDEIVETIFEEVQNLKNQNQLLQEARDILLPRLMMGVIDSDRIAGRVGEEKTYKK